jgi:hypothetical protein
VVRDTACQVRWLLSQRDPDRVRQRTERAALRQQARAERHAIQELMRTGVATTPDREAIARAVRHVNSLFTEAARQLQPIFEALAQRHAEQIRAIRRIYGVTSPSVDPREQALAHVRNRNTGPPERQRVPRRIDPPRSR